MNITPNTVDIALFFIAFVFAFLAFLKGFVKDFFSTVNMIVAIIASYALGPLIAKLIPQSSYPQMAVDLGANFIAFVTILIILSIITSRISNPLSEKVPAIINQTLGFGFGFAKGYFILAFVFAIFLFFYSSMPIMSDAHKDQQPNSGKIGPSWFQQSRSYDILLPGATMLKPVVDEYFKQIKGSVGNSLLKNDTKGGAKDDATAPSGGTIDEILKAKKLYDSLDEENKKVAPVAPDSTPAPTTEPKSDSTTGNPDDSGYTKQEMDKMKRLIEIMGN